MFAVNALNINTPFTRPLSRVTDVPVHYHRAQPTVVLIKLCAAFHTSSPMVILGYSQCDSGCKPAQHPIGAFISPYGLILLNQTHLPKGWAWVSLRKVWCSCCRAFRGELSLKKQNRYIWCQCSQLSPSTMIDQNHKFNKGKRAVSVIYLRVPDFDVACLK